LFKSIIDGKNQTILEIENHLSISKFAPPNQTMFLFKAS